MVSRRAQRRDNAPTATVTSSIIKGPSWPRFYWLWEHARRHTVIMIPNAQEMLQLQRMIDNGNAMCTHKDQLDECIHIEKTTIKEWLATHPGEDHG